MPHDARQAELIRAFKVTGSEYIAKSFVQAFRAVGTVEGTAASEIAETAVAKAAWEAAEKALLAYQAGDR